MRLLIFIFTFCSITIFAQERPVLWCHELNSSDGLTSQAYNHHVYCDSDDFVWISSTKGLNRFNSRSIKQYLSNFQDSTSLYGQNIQSNFFEDQHTNIWFCTYEAIHCYNRQKDEFNHYFIKDISGRVLNEDNKLFFLEKDRFLWVKVAKNIYRIDISNQQSIEEAFERISPITTTDYYHINTGVSKSGDLKYIFASTGTRKKGMEVFQIKDGIVAKGNEKNIFNTSGSIPAVFQVIVEEDNFAWITTDQGIIKWDIENNVKEYLLPKINTPSFIEPYDEDHFIISARNLGLFLYNKQGGQLQQFDLRKIGDSEESYDHNIRNIYLDKNKVLWISRPNNGLLFSHMGKSKFNSLFFNEPSNYLVLNEYKDLVLVSSEKSITLLNKKGEEISRITTENLPHIYHSILTDQGEVLLATAKGLYRYNLKQQQFKIIPNSEKTDFLYLYQLNNNKIIASSQIQGIFEVVVDKKNWSVKNIYKSTKGFVGYTTIYQDALSQIYICENETSVSVFEYEEDKLNPKQNLLIRGSVFCFYEEINKNILWIGTSYGLVKLNKTDFSSPNVLYTHTDGLPDNNVLSIIPAASDDLWMSTAKGLSLMDKQKNTFKNFTLADGMLSNQFKNYSGLKLKDGSIWFGGLNGITVIPPKSIDYIQSSANVIITEIKVDDLVPDSIVCEETSSRNLNEITSLKYTYKENTLSFSFLATDYSDPFNTYLSYKLEGFDEKWVDIDKGKNGFARYSNLPSGEYLFKIKSINSDGENDFSASKSINILITPPFWEETWFKTLLSIIFFSFLFIFIRLRIKAVREKAQLNTRIVENKMSALAAQMSPHFIFNSLQSVNRFILKQDRQQASEYLGRFSKLIRMMLENSRNSEHSLSKEVEFLHLYMKVESQRFKIPFEFNINIDNKIDKFNVYIPTMILQPFVENAIWHGISHKQDAGKIMVTIDQQENLLKCVIEDDGVGRIMAEQLSVHKSHKSRALEIMEERLELLFPEQKHLCKVTYVDLENANNNTPCGTRVIISLPIKE